MPYLVVIFTLCHRTSQSIYFQGFPWQSDGSIRSSQPAIPREDNRQHTIALVIAETACTLADALGRSKGAVNSWNCAVPLLGKYPLWYGYAKMLTAATGVEFTSRKLEEAADRIYAIERPLMCSKALPAGTTAYPKPEIKHTPEGQKERELHEQLLTAYYRLRDYDLQTGIPTRKGLERLGLGYVAPALEANPPVQPWQGPPLWPLASYPHGGRRA